MGLPAGQSAQRAVAWQSLPLINSRYTLLARELKARHLSLNSPLAGLMGRLLLSHPLLRDPLIPSSPETRQVRLLTPSPLLPVFMFLLHPRYPWRAKAKPRARPIRDWAVLPRQACSPVHRDQCHCRHPRLPCLLLGRQSRDQADRVNGSIPNGLPRSHLAGVRRLQAYINARIAAQARTHRRSPLFLFSLLLRASKMSESQTVHSP